MPMVVAISIAFIPQRFSSGKGLLKPPSRHCNLQTGWNEGPRYPQGQDYQLALKVEWLRNVQLFLLFYRLGLGGLYLWLSQLA